MSRHFSQNLFDFEPLWLFDESEEKTSSYKFDRFRDENIPTEDDRYDCKSATWTEKDCHRIMSNLSDPIGKVRYRNLFHLRSMICFFVVFARYGPFSGRSL